MRNLNKEQELYSSINQESEYCSTLPLQHQPSTTVHSIDAVSAEFALGPQSPCRLTRLQRLQSAFYSVVDAIRSKAIAIAIALQLVYLTIQFFKSIPRAIRFPMLLGSGLALIASSLSAFGRYVVLHLIGKSLYRKLNKAIKSLFSAPVKTVCQPNRHNRLLRLTEFEKFQIAQKAQKSQGALPATAEQELAQYNASYLASVGFKSNLDAAQTLEDIESSESLGADENCRHFAAFAALESSQDADYSESSTALNSSIVPIRPFEVNRDKLSVFL